MINATSITIMLCGVACVAACATAPTYQTYTGPTRAPDRVATLHVPGPVVAVDGVPVEDPDARSLAVLPGWHELEWVYVYPNGFSERKRISFVAVAPGVYRLAERFAPAPHPAGILGEIVEFALGAAIFPVAVLSEKEEAVAPPEGEYSSWIVDGESQRVVAGVAPHGPAASDAPSLAVEADDG